MKNKLDVFPKRLTIFSLIFLFSILLAGAYSQFKIFSLLRAVQTRIIPTLQLSCATTRVMSETEQLISSDKPDLQNISFRSSVVDDSLKELLVLNKEFPEVHNTFVEGNNYKDFEKYIISGSKDISELSKFSGLREDLQTMVEKYLLTKNEMIQSQILLGYIFLGISFVGVSLFFVLIYAIYVRYQENSEKLLQVTQNLEQERLATIQSSKLASLGEMAAGLAHEINNPLSVIIGRVEMILTQIQDGTATDFDVSKTLSKINDMAVRISKIVLSMRKISKGSNTNEVSSTNLFGVVDDILNLSAERVRNFSIHLDVSGVRSEPNVIANFTHLSQVLINLLNNGIDELQKCPPEQRTIWISTEENGDEVLLKVKDSGLGIPAEIREKMFQPFYTTKEVGKGTGLGLSISKSLMNDMGGDLFLSDDTSSTCFILKFKKA